jgi:hypothetical protein
MKSIRPKIVELQKNNWDIMDIVKNWASQKNIPIPRIERLLTDIGNKLGKSKLAELGDELADEK